MEKRNVTEKVVGLVQYSGPILITKEILDQIKIGDEIDSGYMEPYYSENESWDGHYYFNINRVRLETDEELAKRKESHNKQALELRNRRYQRYLELKAEFDN